MWPQTTSKRPRRSNLKNWCIFGLKRKLWPWNSSCRDIILAWKIKQPFRHWTIKNIASFKYEAVEAVQGRQPKNWLSMHKSPLLRIPKMNSFYLAWNIILKKVGLKFDKSCLNTLYILYCAQRPSTFRILKLDVHFTAYSLRHRYVGGLY